MPKPQLQLPAETPAFMEDTRTYLRQRWTEAQRTADAIEEALRALGDSNHDAVSPTQSEPRVRRGMSLAARKAASERMKKYWRLRRRKESR